MNIVGPYIFIGLLFAAFIRYGEMLRGVSDPVDWIDQAVMALLWLPLLSTLEEPRRHT